LALRGAEATGAVTEVSGEDGLAEAGEAGPDGTVGESWGAASPTIANADTTSGDANGAAGVVPLSSGSSAASGVEAPAA
jgi:hypothetical protein